MVVSGAIGARILLAVFALCTICRAPARSEEGQRGPRRKRVDRGEHEDEQAHEHAAKEPLLP